MTKTNLRSITLYLSILLTIANASSVVATNPVVTPTPSISPIANNAKSTASESNQILISAPPVPPRSTISSDYPLQLSLNNQNCSITGKQSTFAIFGGDSNHVYKLTNGYYTSAPCTADQYGTCNMSSNNCFTDNTATPPAFPTQSESYNIYVVDVTDESNDLTEQISNSISWNILP